MAKKTIKQKFPLPEDKVGIRKKNRNKNPDVWD